MAPNKVVSLKLVRKKTRENLPKIHKGFLLASLEVLYEIKQANIGFRLYRELRFAEAVNLLR